ncbi:MAG: ATP-binding protein, partial [Raineya sp.]
PEKGKITFEATLIQKEEQNCLLQFRVSDTGKGMSEDEQSRIFNPFEQVGSLSYQELGGTGLGLSVVKQLVEMQKGSIQVYSKKDEGTTFVVALPFEIEKVNSTIGQEENLNFVGLTALVVDDSKISQVYAKKLLQSWGFIVDTAETGKIALDMLQRKYYDLLLTDINIPDFTGDVLADMLEKRNPHSEKTAIIFATGSSEITQFKYPILSKPFEQADLWSLLEQTLPKEKIRLYGMEYLLKITEGKNDFVDDMIESFLQACPEDMKKVEICIENKNAEELYKAIHKLKPMAVLMGSSVLTRVLLLIEKLSKQNNNVDWQNIEKYNRIAKNVAKTACLFFEKQKNEVR